MEQSQADPFPNCFQMMSPSPIHSVHKLPFRLAGSSSFWLYLIIFSQATIRYILWRNHIASRLLLLILAIAILSCHTLKKILPGMEIVSPQLQPFLHCGFMWFDFIFKMSVYIMHEIIPCASGICVIWGQLTAFVRVIGEVIHCYKRIGLRCSLFMLQTWNSVAKCLLCSKVRHLSALSGHIAGSLAQIALLLGSWRQNLSAWGFGTGNLEVFFFFSFLTVTAACDGVESDRYNGMRKKWAQSESLGKLRRACQSDTRFEHKSPREKLKCILLRKLYLRGELITVAGAV